MLCFIVIITDKATLSFTAVAEQDPDVHLSQRKRYSLRELLVATNNFSNKNILGRGGFGKVYKGLLVEVVRGWEGSSMHLS
jgi:hypothetical protein